MKTSRVFISFIFTDKTNPAFVLNDKNIRLNKKVVFIIGQKWFWGLLLLMILLSGLSNTLTLVFAKQEKIVTVFPPDAWGAEAPQPGLIRLQLPVERIIVTHTEDGESCKTHVSSHDFNDSTIVINHVFRMNAFNV